MRYLMLFFLTVFTYSAIASSGGGYGGGNLGLGSNTRTVDQAYEAGKNLFNGRNKTYEKFKICVIDLESNDKVKIKSKTIKPYKGKKARELAYNLYSCDDSERQVVNVLSRNDMNLVLYYLNKRYKLKLQG